MRDVQLGDEAAWSSLYAGYRAFYFLGEDARAVATTWSWLIGHDHGLHGLVAVDASGSLVGLANLRLFARPSIGRLGLYLDDLFTDPASRGVGVGGLLLDASAALAIAEDAVIVRWITAPDNAVARRLYDSRAAATPWVTYDLRPV